MKNAFPGKVVAVGETARRMAAVSAPSVEQTSLQGLASLNENDLAIIDARTAPTAELVMAVASLAGRQAPPAVLLLGGRLPAALIRNLILLGRSDVVDEPFAEVDVAAAIARLADGVHVSAPAASGRLFSLIGAVGGAGATTVAVEMSSQLSLGRGAGRTCLVDLNLCDGAAAAYLGAQPSMRLSEVQTQPGRIDRALVGAMVTSISPTLDLLAAPRNPQAFTETAPETVLRILEAACETYDFVVVDLPRHRQTWTAEVLQGSDEILVVSELTVPALLAARALAEELHVTAPDGPNPQIVINRLASRMMGPTPSMTEAERCLGRKALAGITSDWEAAAASVNLGGAICRHRPRSKIVRDVEALTRKLLDRPAFTKVAA